MHTPCSLLCGLVATAVGLGGIALAAPAAPADPAVPIEQPKISPALAARIPADGTLIAFHRGDGLFVVRLTRRGPVETYHDPAFPGSALRNALVWIDRTTLVAMSRLDERVELRWIVDGKLDPSRTVQVRDADWGREGILGPDNMHVGRGNAVWLEACDEYLEFEGCKRSLWIRVDQAPRTVTKRTPALRKPRSGFGSLPKRRAPRGYAARLNPRHFEYFGGEEMRTVDCTEPSGKVTWGPLTRLDLTLSPWRLQWISQTPPLLAVAGVSISPVDHRANEVWLFAACDSAPLEAAWIGDHMWARRDSSDRYEDGDGWTVYLDDQPIAALHVDGEFEPAPRSRP